MTTSNGHEVDTRFFLTFANPTSSRYLRFLTTSVRRAGDAQRGKRAVTEHALFPWLAAQPLPGSWPCRENFSPKPQSSHLKSVGDDPSRGCQDLKWVTALRCVWRVLCSNKCPLSRRRASGLSWHEMNPSPQSAPSDSSLRGVPHTLVIIGPTGAATTKPTSLLSQSHR